MKPLDLKFALSDTLLQIVLQTKLLDKKQSDSLLKKELEPSSSVKHKDRGLIL